MIHKLIETLDDYIEPETFVSIICVLGNDMNLLTKRVNEKLYEEGLHSTSKYHWRVGSSILNNGHYLKFEEYLTGQNYQIELITSFTNNVNKKDSSFKEKIRSVNLNKSILKNSINNEIILVSYGLQFLDDDKKSTVLYENDKLGKEVFEKIRKISRFMKMDHKDLPTEVSLARYDVTFYGRSIGKLSPEPCDKCNSKDVYENEDRFEGNEDDYVCKWKVCLNCINGDYSQSIYTP